MNKTMLITGATDGIGLAAAKTLIQSGQLSTNDTLLIHGRNASKLAASKAQLEDINSKVIIETYLADLSVFEDVRTFAMQVSAYHQTLDVIINNAAVYKVPNTISANGLDLRFMVNTIAPYYLTRQLLPLLSNQNHNKARIINLSSAAQAPFSPDELQLPSPQGDDVVYAQSKLAITMWSRQMAETLGTKGPTIIAVNPGSLLGSKMVKEAYGIAGGDIQKGADILVKAATSPTFAEASGLYFDNDIGQFTAPHEDALNAAKNKALVLSIENALASII